MTTHCKSLSPADGLVQTLCNYSVIQIKLPQNICKYSKFDFALLAQEAMVP